MMNIQCAWCGKDMGHKEGHEQDVSHSICVRCARIVRYENGIETIGDKIYRWIIAIKKYIK